MTTAVHDVEAGIGGRWRAGAAALAPALGIVAVQLAFFPLSLGLFVRGVIVGLLTALVAVGLALTYKSNRILNFAQGDMGGAPAVLAFLLVLGSGVNYFLALGAGIVAAVLLGGLMELLVVRRFFRASRLVLTVATFGLSQLLVVVSVLLPDLWDEPFLAPRIDAPFDVRVELGGLIFRGNDLIAAVVAPLVLGSLAAFLRYTPAGVAIRASADDADRARLLGVPVKRLQTLVWAVAGLLGFLAIFLRAGIFGLPVGSALSFGILLRALAALMLGRLTNLPAVTASAVALGVLEIGIADNTSSPLLLDPFLGLVIVVALVARRPSRSRTEQSAASSWQLADEVRPTPEELGRLPEVRAVRIVGAAVLATALLVLPHLLTVGDSLKVSAVLIYAVLGLSLVVLTGWAGQISLGQVAFFAIGATVGAKATSEWGFDLLLALVLAAVVGALAATLVGLPALRVSGFPLAVTTFAFALTTTSYLLNRQFFSWVPDSSRVPRPPLFGRIDIESATAYYYVALTGLVVALVAVRGIRRSRSGRVLVALRENEQAAESVGVTAMRSKLAAFAISGALASYAGCLFVHHQHAIGVLPYAPSENLRVFTMVVIGGVTTMTGAVLGAVYVRGAQWLLPPDWQFLASGVGVLFVLLVFPGGLAGLAYGLRDRGLRWVARRRQVAVPSLAAEIGDGRTPGLGNPATPPFRAAAGVDG